MKQTSAETRIWKRFPREEVEIKEGRRQELQACSTSVPGLGQDFDFWGRPDVVLGTTRLQAKTQEADWRTLNQIS